MTDVSVRPRDKVCRQEFLVPETRESKKGCISNAKQTLTPV